MLKLRREAGDGADHFQVYTGTVRVGAIYRAHNTPGGDRWFWGLNGVQNGLGPFNCFVRTLEDAKAQFAASWGAWLTAAGLNEDTPTAQLMSNQTRDILIALGVKIEGQRTCLPGFASSMAGFGLM